MRDILISSAVCVACLLLALVSQLVAPSTVVGAPADRRQAAQSASGRRLRLSSSPANAAAQRCRPSNWIPNDPNPTLFTMATDAGQP